MTQVESQSLSAGEPNVEKLLEHRRDRFVDKKDVSGRIGETSRFISFGLVALVFSIHESDNALSTAIVSHSVFFLNVAGLLGCLAIVSDYLQYLCGYLSVNEALARTDENYSYNSDSLPYRGRRFFFWAKQVLSLVGASIVVVLFSIALL